MNPINVMVNGLPGNVAGIVAGHIHEDKRFELIPYSLTGAEIQESEYSIETVSLELIQPDTKASKIEVIKENWDRQRDFLLETLSKTATQGYSPMHYVFHNLIRYYEKIKEETA